jgi:hypothetical protein
MVVAVATTVTAAPVGGLPITGIPAAGIAMVGGLLHAAGTGAFLAARRRRARFVA